MNVPTEPFKINLNQNLWGLIVSFSALGLADFYKLSALFWLALVISFAMTLSAIITVGVYTYKYCLNKLSS